MNEIMPVIEIPKAFDFIEEDAEAYVEGYEEGAKAQNKADRKWMVECTQEIIEEKSCNQEAALRRLLQALKEAIDE